MDKINIWKVRKETPGCEEVLHFNNAGSSLMPDLVLNSVVNYLKEEATIGGYEAEALYHEQIEGVYTSIARLINCKSNEIAVVENATRAWDMAFYSILFNKGDRILTAKAEYASNYIAFLQVAKRTGAVIDIMPNDEYGQVSIDALKNMIDEKVKLIAITHVPTNGGLVNPAEEIGKIANHAGIMYLLDACQSVGQMPIDVKKIGCDILSATGRKFLRAPRGTGFLYVKENLIEKLEPPFLDLHAATWIDKNNFDIRKDARRFENWECNYAGKIGLGIAVDYALNLGLDSIWERIKNLSSKLRCSLGYISGVQLHDLGENKCGIITFTIDGIPSEKLYKRLSKLKINTSVSISEYARLDMEERNLKSILRASVHYYNTEKEIEKFCNEIDRIRYTI
jgi:cysteine desulfurase / selenocysteine lyase